MRLEIHDVDCNAQFENPLTATRISRNDANAIHACEWPTVITHDEGAMLIALITRAARAYGSGDQCQRRAIFDVTVSN